MARLALNELIMTKATGAVDSKANAISIQCFTTLVVR